MTNTSLTVCRACGLGVALLWAVPPLAPAATLAGDAGTLAIWVSTTDLGDPASLDRHGPPSACSIGTENPMASVSDADPTAVLSLPLDPELESHEIPEPPDWFAEPAAL